MAQNPIHKPEGSHGQAADLKEIAARQHRFSPHFPRLRLGAPPLGFSTAAGARKKGIWQRERRNILLICIGARPRRDDVYHPEKGMSTTMPVPNRVFAGTI
jgi:hypothetical protein